ncbi:MAG: penicillin acylase family protein [Deltaproteobacteria bacterium]|nr:penicillin acylase family protein [Deltaproteobacteria bacterium]
MAEPRAALRRWFNRLAVAGLVLAVVLGLVAAWAFSRMRASLPQIEGAARLPGLGAPVEVERDALGVPSVRGERRLDVARSLGFLHAQDRFFQMDLLRRRAAGELSELFGKVALPLDRRTRRNRFRDVASRVVAGAPGWQRDQLSAYADGVNAGLGSLAARPFEYLVVGTQPAPWRPEDSVLVILAMFIDLHGEEGAREASLAALAEALPAPWFALLAAPGTEWDAPLTGAPFATPPLPGPGVLDLRGSAPAPPVEPRERPSPGSNAWAVAGSLSAHGGAMVADDMHLRLAVPNIWYRASLSWPEEGARRRVTGVTLPGTPAVVAGSNGQVAWGFTNSYGDWQDLVAVERDPADPGRYLAPGGPRAFTRVAEIIKVKGLPDETLEVVGTMWGPLLPDLPGGRQRALAWTAHHPEAVNLELLRLEGAGTLDEALAVANRSGLPPQNFVCADRTGRIGWTIAGVFPRRVGLDGRLPASWADGRRRWDGWLQPEEIPRLTDPPGGRLWTANARTLDGEGLRTLGDGGYALGARARQIRDDLRAAEHFTERDLLAIQLDDRALFLERWHGLLLGLLSPEAVAADARRAEVRRQLLAWGGRASVGSVGYRLVRAFRLAALARVLAPFHALARARDPRYDPAQLTQAEGVAWRLVQERPAHLLPPGNAAWDQLLLAALDDALRSLPGGGDRLAVRTWGERNTTAIRHPLSRALPLLGPLLDMPADAVPGDGDMPRVAAPDFGASERFVVSPGSEESGIFHMPGGQSGHPLSPFYRAGHEAWVNGEPTPFLPGPPAHRLQLTP